MVEESVEQADGRGVLGQEASPVLERPVRADAEGPALVGGGDEAEEQLGPGVVHRSEADLVDQDQVGLEDLLEHPADRVVGQAPIEGLDQLGGAEVADPLDPASTACVAEGDEQVALAGPRRSDQTEVLLGPRPIRGSTR